MTTKNTVTEPRTKKAPKEPTGCWCGCGGLTKSRFVPGHDAKFHSRAKKVARGEATMEDEIASLPHDDAKVEFASHVNKERPKAKAEEPAPAPEPIEPVS